MLHLYPDANDTRPRIFTSKMVGRKKINRLITSSFLTIVAWTFCYPLNITFFYQSRNWALLDSPVLHEVRIMADIGNKRIEDTSESFAEWDTSRTKETLSDMFYINIAFTKCPILCFWGSKSGHLDYQCLLENVAPPISFTASLFFVARCRWLRSWTFFSHPVETCIFFIALEF